MKYLIVVALCRGKEDFSSVLCGSRPVDEQFKLILLSAGPINSDFSVNSAAANVIG